MCCNACCPCFDRMALYLQTKCSEKMIMVMNIIGYVLIVGVVAWRLFRVSVGAVDSTRIFFYIVLSVYLVAFAVALFLAEIKLQKVRLYLNFLDSKTGRGVFMIFISALILENAPVEIILFCIIAVFGSINVLIGCK